jgi:hypothetical protein
LGSSVVALSGVRDEDKPSPWRTVRWGRGVGRDIYRAGRPAVGEKDAAASGVHWRLKLFCSECCEVFFFSRGGQTGHSSHWPLEWAAWCGCNCKLLPSPLISGPTCQLLLTHSKSRTRNCSRLSSDSLHTQGRSHSKTFHFNASNI